ncbi:MAG: hypothetical protein JWM96_696 [Alphaproteobacteria bacterium]|nr:hypothetical protein [Alphaproteobacteria bacterium]
MDYLFIMTPRSFKIVNFTGDYGEIFMLPIRKSMKKPLLNTFFYV